MGYKTSSTRRSTAASTVSSQAVVVNTGGSGNFSIVGSTVSPSTSLTLGIVTPGQTTSQSTVPVSSGGGLSVSKSYGLNLFLGMFYG